MIVDLSDILDEPKHYVFVLEKDWWDPREYDEQVLGLDSALAVNIFISKVGKRFRIEGSIEGTLLLLCDRCLEKYTNKIDSHFDLFLDRLPEAWDVEEVELCEEDMGVDFIRGDEVDLGEIVREQVYLSLPMKSLCSDTCMGLCPTCGANRNKEQCLCAGRPGHPGFEKLRDLKIEGE